MKNLFYRPLVLFLSFLGFMIGFTSKVLAQYGAPVMHYKLLGQVKSVECEQPIGGVEITLVNDVTGEVNKVRTDTSGNFSFSIIEYYWTSEYIMNIADIDGDHNGGAFEPKSFRFIPAELRARNIINNYWETDNEQNRQYYYLDYTGINPCLVDSFAKQITELPDTFVREEEIQPEKAEPIIVQTEEQTFWESEFVEPIILYPNPNDGRFSLEFGLQYGQEVEIRVFSIALQLLDRFFVYLDAGHHTIPIDMSNVSSQTLIVRLKINNEIKDFRVVVM